MSLSHRDFTNAQGDTDWKAYRAARISAGETCYQCDAMIWPAKKCRALCYDCAALETDTGEVDHDDYIRCPHCKTQMEVCHMDDYHLYRDGDHEVTCDECQKTFQIVTTISYSYSSPALIQSDDEDDE